MGINSFEPTDIQATNAAVASRWLVFDPLLDDQTLAELMSPLEPLAIRRNGSHATCDYIGNPIDITQFRQKEKTWLQTWHNQNDARLESEREARFQQYFASLNLDDCIELPGIASYPDGRQEQIMYRTMLEKRFASRFS